MFATPEEAEHAFYEALEQADVVRLMQVWSDDEEIVCIHPGGLRVIGHDAVQDSWQQILGAGPLRVRPSRPLVMLSMMSAIHVLIERVPTSGHPNASFATCYVTNIYHNGPTGWRMVMHHASPAPAEAGVLDLHDIPDMLH